jgi:predicted Rossmann-fold nucleotide-binding protein
MLGRMAAEGTIATADLELMLVTDDVAEAMAHIRRHAVERFGLRRVVIRPTPLLGESKPLPSDT